MKLNREKLNSIILENYIKDIGELAVRKDNTAKSSSIIYDDEDSPERKQIGWEMRKNPQDPQSDWFAAVFTCEIDSFKEQHKDLINKLEQTYGEIYFSTDNCPTARPQKSKSRKYFSVTSGDEVDPGSERGYVPTNSYSVLVNDVLVKNFFDRDGDAEENAERYAQLLRNKGENNVTVSYGGTKKSVSENIKREFRTILKNELGDTSQGKEFEIVLNKRSFPGIIVGDTKYEDRHTDMFLNDKLSFKTHSFNIYPNGNTFLKTVIARATGKESDIKTQTGYLARQFNQNQVNWEAGKTIQKTNYGKTGDPGYVPSYFRKDTYNLNVSGIYAGENEIAIKMLFHILGERIGDSYIWTVKMNNSFGKRESTENWSGRFRPIEYDGKEVELSDTNQFDNKSIIQSETVQLDSGKTYSTNNHILTDPKIKEGLITAIEKFKQKVTSISAGHAIQLAAQRPKKLEEIKKLKNIIKDVINESKSEFKIYHDTYTSAIKEAKQYAEDKGYEIDEDETFTKIGMGPKKPSEGKTNKFSINLKKEGKDQKKHLHIQVYGMEKKYELNVYIN